MAVLIQVKENLAALLEKRAKYRFGWKERERNDHAVRMQQTGPARPVCPHLRIAYSGPPMSEVQAITCIDCQSFVTEPEMRDRGFIFEECPDWVYIDILNEKLQKVFAQGNPVLFVARR